MGRTAVKSWEGIASRTANSRNPENDSTLLTADVQADLSPSQTWADRVASGSGRSEAITMSMDASRQVAFGAFFAVDIDEISRKQWNNITVLLTTSSLWFESGHTSDRKLTVFVYISMKPTERELISLPLVNLLHSAALVPVDVTRPMPVR